MTARTQSVSILSWFSPIRLVIILFAATAIFASAQSIMLGTKKYKLRGFEYNVYNNYTIFKKSFYHLVEGKDLYIHYPREHWDLYKYSPTFALLFGIFALLPDVAGLTLWNLLNALALALAVVYLPSLTQKQKAWILLACVVESMTAIQNEQSNGLMAGLIILALGLCERKKLFLAALCLVLTVFIKIFGLVAFALFLFYPGKWKAALYSAFWFVIFLILPLTAVDLEQLKFLYQSWGNMLSHDHSTSYGLSVMGWLTSWFHLHIDKMLVAIAGALIFLIPLSQFRKYSLYPFRLLCLCSILIWIVIFNHKAESPTFIIAMAGVAIWYFISDKNWLNTSLFIAAIILTTLSPTDIFPPGIRKSLIEPYVLKAVPCILIWLKVIYDMLILRPAPPQ